MCREVYAIAAAFRQGGYGYRTFDNYISVARQRHLTAGFVVDDFVKLAGTRAARAVARGQAPRPAPAPLTH